MEDILKKKLQSLYLAGEREIPWVDLPTSGADQMSSVGAAPTPEAGTACGRPGGGRHHAGGGHSMGLPLQEISDPAKALQEIRDDIGDCQRCRLCQERKNIVFGVGNPRARVMFVGEAPGRDEDIQGEPFVGRAGQLLTKIIEAMRLKREDVYIANVVKCRPPDNRNPAPDEIQTCEPFLLRQIEVIHPKVIVCLGNFAAQTLLQTETKISRLRGNFQPWPSALVKSSFETSIPENSILVMPTFHPAFLLRNPNMKRPLWEDIQKVMKALDEEKNYPA